MCCLHVNFTNVLKVNTAKKIVSKENIKWTVQTKVDVLHINVWFSSWLMTLFVSKMSWCHRDCACYSHNQSFILVVMVTLMGRMGLDPFDPFDGTVWTTFYYHRNNLEGNYDEHVNFIRYTKPKKNASGKVLFQSRVSVSFPEENYHFT